MCAPRRYKLHFTPHGPAPSTHSSNLSLQNPVSNPNYFQSKKVFFFLIKKPRSYYIINASSHPDKRRKKQ